MADHDTDNYEFGCALGAALGVDAWRGDPADIERIGAALRPPLIDLTERAAALIEAFNRVDLSGRSAAPGPQVQSERTSDG